MNVDPDSDTKGQGAFKKFLKTEAAGGVFLIAAAAVALLFENSPLSKLYHKVLLSVPLPLDGIGLGLNVEQWINDLLMALFFFLVGLELKREAKEGALAERSQIVAPAVAAVGGMAVPALFYLGFNLGPSGAIQGWAIPCATDIAFSLGILALFGRGVPITLKIFLTALAIFDDLGAILIIAFFYSGALHWGFLGAAAALIAVLALLNRRGVERPGPYLVIAALLWYAMLRSGVHATIAGVISALFIPMRSAKNPEESPLLHLEHALHPYIAFGVLPIFAFANSGVNLSGLTFEALSHPITLGIITGLFFGKQIGVFLVSLLMIRFGLAKMPEGGNLRMLYGICLLTGIGFTMSLFIGGLAFSGNADAMNEVRAGVILGSLLSAVAGAVVLRRA